VTCVERLKEYETKLRDEHGPSSERVVTVSGLVGVGSSTVAEILSDELGMDLISSGTFFRRKAEEKDLDLPDFFDKYRNPDVGPDPDLMWDRRVLGLAFTKDDVVIEGRLTGALLCDIAEVRILVECSRDVVVERLAEREKMTPDEADERLERRNSQDIKTYKEKYGIDVRDKKYYNVVVDNSGSLEDTKKMIIEKVNAFIGE